MKTPYRNRLPMVYLPASRAVDTVGMDPMFYGRVSGVGTPVARLDDGTETVFYPAGLQYRFQSTPSQIVLDNGVPRMVEGPPEGPVRMYDLQVTVKNYVPGSNQVSYTTWGRGLYPGFNPTPNWKTVSEAEFMTMYPGWVFVRNAKFGTASQGETRIITPVPPRTPPPVMLPAPVPTTGGASALPLLLGAAFLLLS